VEEQTRDIQDYVVAIRKRKNAIIAITALILTISTAVAFLLPPVYKSSATILIEQQEIPPELVMSTVTSYAAERIQTIQARVMSRTTLLEIIKKFNLYENERKYETSEAIVEKMREDTTMEVISAEVVDPRTGQPTVATIAFSLSFKGDAPEKVQRVASELTSLYLNENLKSRSQKAEDTSLFFKEEKGRLSNQINELETALAEFKQKNADSLPEVQSLNLQILQRTETELTTIDTRLTSLEDRKIYLEGQLALIDPGNPAILGIETRLKLLESEYISVKSKYSSEHPDVQKIKREIDSLKNDTGTSDKSGLLAEELLTLRGELAQIREKYTNEHPDVARLEEKIASLNKELANTPSNAEEEYYKNEPDNPAYITLKAQLESTLSEIKAITIQRETIVKKIADLEQRLYKAPQVERQYLALRRDYRNAVKSYQETQAKLMQADVAKQLESESKGERFTLIDPPALPEEPISPNRTAIFFLGFILSLGGGFGFAIVANAVSGAVRGAKSVEFLLGIKPLAEIPYQMNLAEITRRVRHRKRVIIFVIVCIISALIVIHFLISPLDVLWFRVMRKLDILMA
jgi:uncharacterized protein involved in exopolysaccharide biosynthesis